MKYVMSIAGIGHKVLFSKQNLDIPKAGLGLDWMYKPLLVLS